MRIAVDIVMIWLFREELQSIQRELEVLSEQYSQKCLENAHLAQALEAERQALRQCQRENQELNAHNQVWMHIDTHEHTKAFLSSRLKHNFILSNRN